jgi:PAS domain S-box-containing protein
MRGIDESKKLDYHLSMELRESEGRFSAIFEQAAVGMAQIDSHTGEFNLINQKYCDIVGYSREEMTSRTFQASIRRIFLGT